MSSEPHTYERGRFYIGPNGFPRFAGSSSGVYLAGTLSSELSPAQHINASGIDDVYVNRNNDIEPRKDEVSHYSQFTLLASDLKHHDRIRHALRRYFAVWHPLFPFLDGAYLISSFDSAVALAQMNEAITASLASTSGAPAPPARQRQAFDGLKEEEDLVMSAILKAVITIGAMDLSAEERVGLPVWFSTTQVTMIGHFIIGAIENSSVSDLLAIQALVGIELYLYLSRLMRPAMHISGVLSKLAFEAGLHRCPERFANTFTQPADRQLRKRVFYSLYVLDRILTAEFGIPIMLHDTDVDTCIPGGTEKHSTDRFSPDHPARTPNTDLASAAEIASNGERPAKRARTEAAPGSVVGAPSVASGTYTSPQVPTVQVNRLLPVYSLVGIQKIGGRAMELFNKSIQHRLLDPGETIQLRTDLDRWWNDMSLDADDGEEDAVQDDRSQYSTLFTCLYHQQIIALARPALSQSPAKMEHAHALQTAVMSARTMCTVLHRQLFTDDLDVWWPGYVDMVFFSALILVYNAKREIQSGSSEVNRSKSALAKAIKVLSRLAERWSNINSFIRILETLSSPLQPEARLPESTLPMSYPSNPFAMGMGNTENSLGNVPDPFGGDFSFDFETFGINPDALWAFHNSIPGSPTFL